jgi:hypothetical protein
LLDDLGRRERNPWNYAWFRLGDVSLAAISACNAASCASVLVLAAYKRAEAVGSLVPGMNSVRLGRKMHQVRGAVRLFLRVDIILVPTGNLTEAHLTERLDD